jgi:DNA-binding NtrC family response regulator
VSYLAAMNCTGIAEGNYLMSKILVADRDLSRAQFIKRILVRRDISNCGDIGLINDGLQARETLLENSYNLVIIGEELGGMSGLDCIRFLQEKNIKHSILLMIQTPRVEITREAILLGVQGYYEIPIWVDGFVAIIQGMLSNRRIDFGTKIYKLYTKRLS